MIIAYVFIFMMNVLAPYERTLDCLLLTNEVNYKWMLKVGMMKI